MVVAASQFKAITISFSGAGHLLPYHLGVAAVLSQSLASRKITKSGTESASPSPRVVAVSGSSSGAIAATALVYLSHRIEEYADRFICDGGRAMFHLTEMVREQQGNQPQRTDAGANATELMPSLHIATTRCSDGMLQLFDFPSGSALAASKTEMDRALICINASCKIPSHFHPSDVLPSSRLWGWSQPSTYPEQDGVSIDGKSYADGGISAPAPPTPMDDDDGVGRVVVSPISGSAASGTIRVSPSDASQRLWPFEITCRGDFRVRASFQNVRAMQVAAGMGTKDNLRSWYERGMDDGTRFLTK